jgi:hypothetical protein
MRSWVYGGEGKGGEGTYDERVVVVLELGEPAAAGVGGHGCGECPFVDCGCVFLVERGGDEGFEDEPAAEVDAA